MKKNLFILIFLIVIVILFNYENLYEVYLNLGDMSKGTYSIFLNLFLLLSIFYWYNRFKLKKLNNSLKVKLLLLTKEMEKKEKILSQKSKMATMGEMMDSIAHQWIQPISIIRMKIQIMQMEYELDRLSNNDIEDTIRSVNVQIDHLVNTIDEFRLFFSPSLKAEQVSVSFLLNSALLLIEDELKKNQISTRVIGDKSFYINVNPNEFKHVIINMINNAKDAFIQKNLQERKIVFTISKIQDKVLLKISDNAGGIPPHIVKNIFDPYFTTKKESGGTGIGLYMVKQIIEKYKGKIYIENIECGTCFIIKI